MHVQSKFVSTILEKMENILTMDDAFCKCSKGLPFCSLQCEMNLQWEWTKAKWRREKQEDVKGKPSLLSWSWGVCLILDLLRRYLGSIPRDERHFRGYTGKLRVCISLKLWSSPCNSTYMTATSLKPLLYFTLTWRKILWQRKNLSNLINKSNM